MESDALSLGALVEPLPDRSRKPDRSWDGGAGLLALPWPTRANVNDALGRSRRPSFSPPSPRSPIRLRHFDGKAPAKLSTGTPWEKADFQHVSQTTKIYPGFFLLTTKPEKAGTVDMNELSLAIRTPRDSSWWWAVRTLGWRRSSVRLRRSIRSSIS